MPTSRPLFHGEAPALSLHTPRKACQTIHQHQTLATAAAESSTASQTTRPQLPTRTPGSLPLQLTRLAAAPAADGRDILPSAASWLFHHDAVPRLSAHDTAVIRRHTTFFNAAFRIEQHIWDEQKPVECQDSRISTFWCKLLALRDTQRGCFLLFIGCWQDSMMLACVRIFFFLP